MHSEVFFPISSLGVVIFILDSTKNSRQKKSASLRDFASPAQRDVMQAEAVFDQRPDAHLNRLRSEDFKVKGRGR